MNFKYCERCKKWFPVHDGEPLVDSFIVFRVTKVNNDGQATLEEEGLCHECLEELAQWINHSDWGKD